MLPRLDTAYAKRRMIRGAQNDTIRCSCRRASMVAVDVVRIRAVSVRQTQNRPVDKSVLVGVMRDALMQTTNKLENMFFGSPQFCLVYIFLMLGPPNVSPRQP